MIRHSSKPGFIPASGFANSPRSCRAPCYSLIVSAAVLMTAGGPHSVAAQSELKTYHTAKECRTIENATVRLFCYDSVVDGTPYSPEDQRKLVQETFGKSAREEERLVKETPADKVLVEIVSVKQLRTGKRIFTTASGQVWKQTLSDHVPMEKTPYKAEIKKVAFGYSLVSLERPKVVKVERVK